MPVAVVVVPEPVPSVVSLTVVTLSLAVVVALPFSEVWSVPAPVEVLLLPTVDEVTSVVETVVSVSEPLTEDSEPSVVVVTAVVVVCFAEALITSVPVTLS